MSVALRLSKAASNALGKESIGDDIAFRAVAVTLSAQIGDGANADVYALPEGSGGTIVSVVVTGSKLATATCADGKTVNIAAAGGNIAINTVLTLWLMTTPVA